MINLRFTGKTLLPIVDRLGLKKCIGTRINQKLCLHRDDRISVFFAPFDASRTKRDFAGIKVFFVGLTPGFQQAEAAFSRYFDLIQPAHDSVSFRGAMRSNLVRIMDRLELPEALGITTTADLFGDRRDLAASTSLLKFPVFTGVQMKNYSGSPVPTTHLFLRRMVDEIFVPEIECLPQNTLIVPFGKVVGEELRPIARRLGPEFERRCLWEFPHPSGANAGQVAKFLSGDLTQCRTVIQQTTKV